MPWSFGPESNKTHFRTLIFVFTAEGLSHMRCAWVTHLTSTLLMGGSRGSPPLHFGGPPNFIKREIITLCAQTRKRRGLVLNSYLDPPPPFLKSCIRPCCFFGPVPFELFQFISRKVHILNHTLNGFNLSLIACSD